MVLVAHVLDGTYGKPAAGVRACLARVEANGWSTVAEAETDGDGYIKDWGPLPLNRRLYRIVFDSDSYFAGLGTATASPEVAVIFRVPGESVAFQVQVTLAPYSYSAYFGTTYPESGR